MKESNISQFQNFKTRRSTLLISSLTPIDGFRGCKEAKCSVGNYIALAMRLYLNFFFTHMAFFLPTAYEVMERKVLVLKPCQLCAISK